MAERAPSGAGLVQDVTMPERYELIFEAPRESFAQGTGAALLEEEVGLSPKDVAELVERVEEQVLEDEE